MSRGVPDPYTDVSQINSTIVPALSFLDWPFSDLHREPFSMTIFGFAPEDNTSVVFFSLIEIYVNIGHNQDQYHARTQSKSCRVLSQ